MATIAAVRPSVSLPKVNFAELLKLVGLPSEKERAAKIVDSAGEVVRNVVSVIDDLVSAAIEKRTAEDFVAIRALVYPQYFVAMRALGDIARIVLPMQTIDRL